MPHVFLSYSKHDNKWVNAFEELLASELRKRDPIITVWRDKNKLRAGDDWNEVIEAAVRSAEFFCLVASGGYRLSVKMREGIWKMRDSALTGGDFQGIGIYQSDSRVAKLY